MDFPASGATTTTTAGLAPSRSWRQVRELIRLRWQRLRRAMTARLRLLRGHVPQTLPLVEACKQNDLALMDTLLRRGEVVDQADAKGITALRVATDNGNVQAATLLLRYGADPNHIDRDGWAVIHSAIVEGSSGIVEALLNGGADPYIKGSYGWNALHTAVASGRHRLVRLILRRDRVTRELPPLLAAESTLEPATEINEAGPSSSGSDKSKTVIPASVKTSPLERSGSSVLMRKVLQHNNDVLDEPVQLLVMRSVQHHQSTPSADKVPQDGIDAQTDHGQTALHLVAHEGHALSMRLLLLYGADPNIQDNKGRVPLFEACRRSNVACVDLLLRHGALKIGLTNSYSEAVQAVLDRHPGVPSLRTLCLLNIRKVLKGKTELLRNLPSELAHELQTLPNGVEASLRYSTTIAERRGRLSTSLNVPTNAVLTDDGVAAAPTPTPTTG